jgi:hypothetical protein
MACARHLNLHQLPIVCVNVNKYYDPFQEMLEKAYEDKLIKLTPEEIVHFASSAEEAVRWIEAVTTGTPSLETAKKQRISLRHKKSILKRSSFFAASPFQDGRSSLLSMYTSMNQDDEDGASRNMFPWHQLGLTFAIGAAFGMILSSSLVRGQ